MLFQWSGTLVRDVNALAAAPSHIKVFSALVTIAEYGPMLGDKVKRKSGSEKPINFSYNKWAHLAVPMLISLIICFWGIEGIHFAKYVALSNGDCGAWSFDVTVNFTCGVEMKGMVGGAWSGRGPNEGGGLSIPSKVNALTASVAAVSCGRFFTMAITEDGKL
ncbi:hypothetical protein Syun_008594 [Stephania yunnanensis]|uniref:Uncharacterized protein n=1 Tax=Stephania yunnanensis TaxID=152371 RepID=A0AAP0KFL2_9MAGN